MKNEMTSAPGKPTLRSQVLCPILGKPEDLKTNVLPTTEELMKYYLYLKFESDVEKPIGLLSKIVDSVLQIWKSSGVPTLSKPRVTKLFKNKLDNYASLKKSIGRREAETFKVKLAAFKKTSLVYLHIGLQMHGFYIMCLSKREESTNKRASFYS